MLLLPRRHLRLLLLLLRLCLFLTAFKTVKAFMYRVDLLWWLLLIIHHFRLEHPLRHLLRLLGLLAPHLVLMPTDRPTTYTPRAGATGGTSEQWRQNNHERT